MNQTYSWWEEILFRVPKGSISGSNPFNIFLSDLFHVIRVIYFASYADNNTIYVAGESLDNLISSF